ncbi:MAG: hypothetical protein D6683_05585 [Actinomyces sp.]|nr:MAG: hypothetical protein D6683_05585 [Actinomyces sp.]
MLERKSFWGAATGAVVAVVWATLGGQAVLLAAVLAAVGWLVGLVLDRPDILISLLQRLQER